MFPLLSTFPRVPTFFKIIRKTIENSIQKFWYPYNTDSMIAIVKIGN